MIYPGTDPLKFSLKHGLPLEEVSCRNCGMKVKVNIPIISKDYVGFESELHEPCGKAFVISIVKPMFDLEKRL